MICCSARTSGFVSRFGLPVLFSLALIAFIVIKWMAMGAGAPAEAIAPLGSDDPSIIASLGDTILKYGYIPDIDFYQEYAPGFHYVIALIMKFLGGGAPAISLGMSITHLFLVPAGIGVLAALIFRRWLWVLAVVALYFAVLPWTGIKGLAFLAALIVIVPGDPAKPAFHFKAGLATGLLVWFAQEFAVYLGFGFAVYTWLCASLETDPKRRMRRFIRLAAASLCGFLITTLPVLIFYASRGSLSNLVLYMFQIGMGPQAEYMKLPYCFNCAKGFDMLKVRYYLTPFIPIFTGFVLATSVTRHKNWMKMLLLVLVTNTTIVTALGRSAIANITLGGWLDFMLIAVMLCHVRKSVGWRDSTSIVLFLAAFVLQIVILTNSWDFGRLQILVVLLVGAFLARSVPLNAGVAEAAERGRPASIDFRLKLGRCEISFAQEGKFFTAVSYFLAAVVTVLFLWTVPSEMIDAYHTNIGGWARFTDGVHQFMDKHKSWERGAMATDETTAQKLIDYVSKLPADEIFVFPRSASLYAATGKRNATKNYFFAQYFSRTPEPPRLIQTLEDKKLQYVIVEEDLAARAAAPVYWYILEHYEKENQIGTYAIYHRAKTPAKEIVVTRIVDSFEPETKAHEYIWANYMKRVPGKPQFGDYLFQHPPHAKCVLWPHMDWLKDYRTLDITWSANPDIAVHGDVSLLANGPNGWETVAARHLPTPTSTGKLVLDDINARNWTQLKFCSELGNGTYFRVVAAR